MIFLFVIVGQTKKIAMEKIEFVVKNVSVGDRFSTMDVAWIVASVSRRAVCLSQSANPSALVEIEMEEFFDRMPARRDNPD